MFLTKADLSATLYPEITAMMSRYSEGIINMNLAAAESEIEALLGARYNIRPVLEQVGEARHTYLLSLARDLAVYHLYSLQETIPAHRVKRYDQAIAMLKLIQEGKSTLPGVAPAVEPEVITPQSGQIGWGGTPARPTLNNPWSYNPFK